MPVLELSVESGETSLSVKRFGVAERISALFTVSVWLYSPKHDLDLESIVGRSASLLVASGVKNATSDTRVWSGVCSRVEQIQAEVSGAGVSSYYMCISPSLWLLTQRRNHRIFQHLSIPDIVDELLAEWGIAPEWRIDRGQYPKLEYKIQYGESDYAFMSRLLEEAGIAYIFLNQPEQQSQLVLSDALQGEAPRPGPPIHYVDKPNQAAEMEFVTKVKLAHQVRPGAFAIRDYSFRKPNYPLASEAPKAEAPEDQYEQYHYQPGGFLVEVDKGGDTPVADDKGVARYEVTAGQSRAERMLQAERADQCVVSFETNAIDLLPGAVFSVGQHPHDALDSANKLLLVEFALEGSANGEWSYMGEAVLADRPYRPKLATPKPEISGVQSATVVGPAGEEIHTDEFGRVRVEFPWQRTEKQDDNSSCWIRVNQGWAGTGYGLITIPRVGQEVLVGFLDGDPDQPLIVGRVFNNTQPVPYELPKHKTRSTWKSNSSPGSGGFNEIMFEDLTGSELIYIQAQKNLRKLVKNDETITVGHDRQKLVQNNETETTVVNRVEVTGVSRTEITGADRTTVVGAAMLKQVGGDELERTDGNMQLYVGGEQDIVIKQVKRERVEGDSHLLVKGKRNQQINGTQSLTIGGDQQEKIANCHALDADKEIHFKAGTSLVVEAAQDLTLKGPGGFIRIDAGGVTIKGDLVKINSGGSAGSGSGSSPEEPEEAQEAEFKLPEAPEPDDVAVSGLAQ